MNSSSQTSELEFQLESLESRLLMAADWTATGNSLKITADDANDFVAVTQDGGNVMVQLSSDGMLEDTGISNLDRLTINTGAGDDVVEVDADAAKLAKVVLGDGDDTLRFSGDHKKAIANGGKGEDFIVMGGVTADRGRIIGGADNDTVGFDFAAYSFGQLNGLPEDKITITLGAGDDTFQLMFEDLIVGEDNIDAIGFPGVDTVPDLIDSLSNSGFGDALKGFKMIGGRDTDALLGDGAIELFVGLGAKVRTFEITTLEVMV